jgi:hypothetical protein
MHPASLIAKVADMNKHPAPAKRAEAWKEANQELKKVDRKFFWGVNGSLIENWAAIADPGGPGSCFLSYAAPANGSRSTSKANCPYGRLFEGTCKMKGCLNNYDHTNPAKMLPDPVRIKIFERTVAQVSSGPGSPPTLDLVTTSRDVAPATYHTLTYPLSPPPPLTVQLTALGVEMP